MRLLSKLKIKSQITLLLIFPLLGLIYFATSIVSEKYFMAQKMDGLANLVQFSIKISNIIHELQRERGVSGLFLENQGDTFATQELSQQRVRTDEVIKELDQFLNLINIKDDYQDFQAELAHLDNLKHLDSLRETVDTRQIIESQAVENYLKIDEGLLDMIIGIASVDTRQDIFRFELAYINLLMAKEKAGLERSLLANAFVHKYFEPGEFKRFCELVAEQQVLLQRINELYVDQATGNFLKAKWSGKIIDETQRLRKIAYAATTDGVIENIDPNYWFKMQSGKMNILKEMADKIANTLHDKAKHIESEIEHQFMTVLIVTVIILMLAALFVFLVSRETTASIRKTVHIAHAIAQGKLDNTIEVQATNEVGELLQAFLSMQTQLRERIEADKRIADEALRVNQALNTVSTSVFITDNHYQIIYANKAAYQLFKDNEFKIRKHLPNFDANNLVGSSIDMFHQNPNYQHQILTRLKTAHKANINIGELNMDLIITPVINAEGEHLGWVSEWNDRTAEVATEKEINHVMLAASQGDFSQRIVLENKTGFFKTLGEVLNQTLDYNQQMVDELMHVFAAIARGDLSQTITHNYAGSLEQLKNDVNATVMTLTNVMTAIQQTADAASQGDFTQRIDIKDKQGFFRALSEVLNHILDYNKQMVEDLMRVFAAIAQGDLTQTIIRNYAGTLEQLKNDVNTSIAVLTNVIDTVKHASASVSLAAEEISQGNLNLSQRTEEQAASLEQTAASMEQMTSTVQQNTDHTRQAAELATDAREQARQGGEVVNSAITAMSTINQSSKQVYDIIGVIDDIAFQTNLLALNAAVEAARAGEQGRGFAVVATEVRNLAQRSAAAAKEIKKLIQDSVNKVEEGSRLVNHSGQVLEQIVLAVRKVSDIISEIASASQEQTSGIHQVNKAVSQMEEMTQQNAALVEQSASASESMREQAEHLSKQIAFFQTT